MPFIVMSFHVSHLQSINPAIIMSSACEDVLKQDANITKTFMQYKYHSCVFKFSNCAFNLLQIPFIPAVLLLSINIPAVCI
jgi:hypothetical protein